MLTRSLEDQIASEYLPLVSGYTVTFDTPWPTETTHTVIFSGSPVAGEVWTVDLTTGGNPKEFRHTVADGETLADVLAALAVAIGENEADSLSATATGAALVIRNTAGNTDSVSVGIENGPAIDPGSYAIDETTASSTTVTLDGSPVVEEIWAVQLAVDAGIYTFTHRGGRRRHPDRYRPAGWRPRSMPLPRKISLPRRTVKRS